MTYYLFYPGQMFEDDMINLSPYSQPAKLSTWLEERGFQRDMNHAKLLRKNSPIEETSCD